MARKNILKYNKKDCNISVQEKFTSYAKKERVGISGSERVKTALYKSPEFNSDCDSASLSLAQHAFAGVLPSQLHSAAAHIHRNLSSLRFPLITRWVSSPPSQSQIDSALRVTITRSAAEEADEILGLEEFKEWAVEVFSESVVGNAKKAMASRIPLGIAGIAGIGAVTRSDQNLIGAVIGVYAIGVATWVYLSLSD